MSNQIPNIFTTYYHNDNEQVANSVFNQGNMEYLHNQRANIAQQKIHINIDPNNINEFLQQDAYLRGQLDILTFLLNASEEASNLLVGQANQQAITTVTTELNSSPMAVVFGVD